MKKHTALTLAKFIFLLQAIFLLSPKNSAAQTVSLESPLHNCWTFSTNEISERGVASDNEVVILPLINGTIIALKSKTGEKLWQTQLGGKIISNPLVSNKILYILSSPRTPDTDNFKSEKASVRAINTQTGITVWHTNIDSETESHLLADEKMLLIIGKEGILSALNRSDGAFIWQQNFNAKITAFQHFQSEDLLAFSDKEKIIFISDIEGSIQNILKTKNAVTSIYGLHKNRIFLGSKSGELSDIDVLRKSFKWRVRNGAEISGLQLVSEGLLATSHDNFVYLINPGNGDKVWKKRLAGRILGSPVIEGNFAVFTTQSIPNLTIIELGSGKVVNQVSMPEDYTPLDSPNLSGGFLILPTVRGLFAFGNAGACSENQNKQ